MESNPVILPWRRLEMEKERAMKKAIFCLKSDRMLNPDRKYLSVHSVIKIVAVYFGITPEKILGFDGHYPFVIMRFTAIYLANEFCMMQVFNKEKLKIKKISATSLGRYFKRDHTTIISALKQVKWLFINDPEFCQSVAELSEVLKMVWEEKLDEGKV